MKLPMAIEEALYKMKAGQSLVLSLQPERAKKLKRALMDFIYQKQAEGLLSLDYDIKVLNNPSGLSTLVVNVYPPMEAQIVETDEEKGELKVIEKFTIIGGLK